MKILIAVLGAASLAASAQTPTPAAPKPTITELQQAKLDLATCQVNLVRVQANVLASPWLTKQNSVIEEIKAANPGYQWSTNPQTGEGMLVRAVPDPAPPATQPPAPPAK